MLDPWSFSTGAFESMAERMEQALQELAVRLQATEARLVALVDENAAFRAAAAAAAAAPAQVVDTRLLAKPAMFTGTQETWAEWSFTFKAYIAAVSPRMRALLDEASAADAAVVMRNVGDTNLSVQLYYILVLTVKDVALQKLMSVPEENGFEVWRIFNLEWEPRQKARFTAMLRAILKAEFKDPPMPGIENWERQVRRYEEQSGEEIPDSIKASVLSGGLANEKLRDHIALNAFRLNTYAEVRTEVQRICAAQREWTAQVASDAPVPMEIGALGKGKGKKGKGKGKGKSKGGKGGDENKEKEERAPRGGAP